MAKSIDVGVNGVARNVTAIYVGVNGVARKVTKAYVGVNGVAREFYQSIIPITITANNQTITYGNSIGTGVNYATVSGLPSGYTFSSITLTQSTTSVTTSGYITPSAAVIKDSGNVDVTNKFAITYVNGSLVINKANPSYTAPTAKSLTYNGTTNTNGTAQACLNAGSTSHGTIQYSSDNSSWSTTIPTLTNAGSATVYWRLIGDSNHNDVGSTSISASMARKGIARVTGQTTSFTYNGSSQSVVVNNYDSNTITRGGTYSAVNASTSYSATYTPMSNFQWSSGSSTTSAITITWSIAKANPSYTAPTAKSGLTYNGSTNTNGTAQALANAGSTSHGTIYYSTNNSTWSTSVPTSTNAGSTTVYWKLTGDSNHNDVGSTSLGSISIARKGITRVTASSTSYDYTGSSISLSVNNYDSNTITRGGTYSATNAGSYTATYTPMSNFKWSSGSSTTSAISIDWSISQLDNRVVTFTSTSPFKLWRDYKPNSDETAYEKTNDGTLYYSTNYSTWTAFPTTSSVQYLEITTARLYSGKYTIFMRGSGNTIICKNGTNSNPNGEFYFTSTSNTKLESPLEISGNIETLLDYSQVNNNIHPTMGKYCFYGLFQSGFTPPGASESVSSPNLILSNLNLSSKTCAEYAYSKMFYSTTIQEGLSELPCEILANYCYEAMFGMTTWPNGIALPKINARELGNHSCSNMYAGLGLIQTVDPSWLINVTTLYSNRYPLNSIALGAVASGLTLELNFRNVTTIGTSAIQCPDSFSYMVFSTKLNSVESNALTANSKVRLEFTDNDSYSFSPGNFVTAGTKKSSRTYTFYTDNTSMKNALIAKAGDYTTVNVYHLNGSAW